MHKQRQSRHSRPLHLPVFSHSKWIMLECHSTTLAIIRQISCQLSNDGRSGFLSFASFVFMSLIIRYTACIRSHRLIIFRLVGFCLSRPFLSSTSPPHQRLIWTLYWYNSVISSDVFYIYEGHKDSFLRIWWGLRVRRFWRSLLGQRMLFGRCLFGNSLLRVSCIFPCKSFCNCSSACFFLFIKAQQFADFLHLLAEILLAHFSSALWKKLALLQSQLPVGNTSV